MQIARGLAIVSVCLAILAGNARADGACDEAAAEVRIGEITRLLDDQARRTRLWNVGWAIGFSAVAVGQGVFTWKPSWSPIDIDADLREGMGVSAGKAAIAALSRIILPLKGERFGYRPDETACSALPRAEGALAYTARRQKRSFWLNHIGGIALNLSGVAVLGFAYDNWGGALTSFVLGSAVGAASSYTMPRGAWKAQRRWYPDGLTVTPVVSAETRGLAVGWAF